MLESENQRGDKERPEEELSERDALKIGAGQIAIQKGTKENLFQRGDHQGRAEDSDQHEGTPKG